MKKQKQEQHNVIPNDFLMIEAIQLQENYTGNANDLWHIYKNDNGLLGINTRTGKYYYIFRCHLRTKAQWQIVNIERREQYDKK